MKYYVGIDLGGTNIAAGVVDSQYNIIATAKTKTNMPRSASEIANDMSRVAIDAIANAGLKKSDIEWIGIGSPGLINRDLGIVEYSNNLGFNDVPLAKFVENGTGIRTYIDNDANVAAYGEFVAGSAKGTNNAIVITLGTGVGAGIIIDGHLYSGSNFGGAEIGHMVIEIDGYNCTCGRKGCFEVYSSATGLVRMTRECMDKHPDSLMWVISRQYGKVSARTAFEAMRAGDEAGRLVVEKYIKHLACGIANTINIFQPEILCIGGGVCNEGDALLNPLLEIIANEVYTRESGRNTRIEIASLGNNAGIIGAALLGTAIKRNQH
ncbi:MAG: ROK family protein [Clostridiales bacterium]|nr:ROK family protein [Clostridiales bacterium]